MTRPHKIALIVVLIAMLHLLLVVVFGDKGLVEFNRMRVSHNALVETNERLTKENLQMYRTIDRLQNDPAFIENTARRELGMIRADEVVFQFSGSAGQP